MRAQTWRRCSGVDESGARVKPVGEGSDECTMPVDRSRYGLLVAALGSILLAVAVFLPWYGLSLTANGAAVAQQVSTQVATEFGSPALQAQMSGLHDEIGALQGHQLTAVSAHQVLKHVSIVLLVLAALGILLALIPLAAAAPSAGGSGGMWIALLGVLAAAFIVYRIVDPPTVADGVLELSLREGAWLALLGSLAMIVGGLWPRRSNARTASQDTLERAWSELSGWTPERS